MGEEQRTHIFSGKIKKKTKLIYYTEIREKCINYDEIFCSLRKF